MIESVEIIRSSLAQVKSDQINFETFAYQLCNASVDDLGNTYPAIAEELAYLHEDACSSMPQCGLPANLLTYSSFVTQLMYLCTLSQLTKTS
jgi:hypothetical protein